jgi:hypothetical protein
MLRSYKVIIVRNRACQRRSQQDQGFWRSWWGYGLGYFLWSFIVVYLLLRVLQPHS